MNASSSSPRRGSQRDEINDDEHGVEGREATEAGVIERLDQVTWEAPPLRPTFATVDEHEHMANDCPDWCAGDHDPEKLMTDSRRMHRSTSLLVRQDNALGYADYVDERPGVMAGHLELQLVARDRDLVPQVAVIAHWGDGRGEPKSWRASPLYADEVRELIAVLQHLLKVGA